MTQTMNSVFDQLKSQDNRGTGCISVVSPFGDISRLQSMLSKEITTAENIKDKSNRKAVVKGLTKMHNYLCEQKTMPSTGIAMFIGQCI